jgi:Spy/CpxP family protein refolding chaperone
MMTFQTKRLPALLSIGAGALILAVGFGAAATVSAQNTSQAAPPFHGRGFGPGGPGMPGGPLAMFLGRAAERLGLSDAQQSQIKTIAESHKSDMQSVFKQVADARRTLLAAQVNGQADDQIRQLSAQVAQAEANAAVAETHVIAEVMQVLTPDQQAQVKNMIQNGPRPGGRRAK